MKQKMQLSEIKKKIKIKKIINLHKFKKFNKIISNSKELDNKSLFVSDSKKKIKKIFLKEAIKKNISAIITNKPHKNIPITQLVVEDLDSEVTKLLILIKPNKPKHTIAITGTNGKTTVAWYISQICTLNKIKIKMQGTLGYYINNKKNKNSNLTTPNYEILHQNAFSKIKNDYNFVFEASSHALDQNRINKFPINIAAITNISHDHLDYHKTIRNYKNSKLKLFSKYLDTNGIAIINSRLKNKLEFINNLIKNNTKYILYGEKYLFIKKINQNLYLFLNNKKYELDNLNYSKIDIENIECAIACCLQLNIKIKDIIKSLKYIKFTPGRSQVIFNKKNSTKVIIDFAHTPDALKNILIVNTINSKKPNLVFGCGGNRDKKKRKLMGLLANKYANEIIITDDNPRNEKPSKIRSEIIQYCPKAINIPDRRKAIEKAINSLKKNDILIIAGKGHEKFQVLKNKKIKFDDYKIAEQILKYEN